MSSRKRTFHRSNVKREPQFGVSQRLFEEIQETLEKHCVDARTIESLQHCNLNFADAKFDLLSQSEAEIYIRKTKVLSHKVLKNADLRRTIFGFLMFSDQPSDEVSMELKQKIRVGTHVVIRFDASWRSCKVLRLHSTEPKIFVSNSENILPQYEWLITDPNNVVLSPDRLIRDITSSKATRFEMQRQLKRIKSRWDKKDFESALEWVKHFCQICPADVFEKATLLRAYLAGSVDGDVQEASRAFQSLFEKATSPIEQTRIRCLMGEISFSNEHYKEAISHFESACALNFMDAYLFKAEAHLAQADTTPDADQKKIQMKEALVCLEQYAASSAKSKGVSDLLCKISMKCLHIFHGLGRFDDIAQFLLLMVYRNFSSSKLQSKLYHRLFELVSKFEVCGERLGFQTLDFLETVLNDHPQNASLLFAKLLLTHGTYPRRALKSARILVSNIENVDQAELCFNTFLVCGEIDEARSIAQAHNIDYTAAYRKFPPKMGRFYKLGKRILEGDINLNMTTQEQESTWDQLFLGPLSRNGIRFDKGLTRVPRDYFWRDVFQKFNTLLLNIMGRAHAPFLMPRGAHEWSTDMEQRWNVQVGDKEIAYIRIWWMPPSELNLIPKQSDLLHRFRQM